jgi:hypothetical protein
MYAGANMGHPSRTKDLGEEIKPARTALLGDLIGLPLPNIKVLLSRLLKEKASYADATRLERCL